MQSARALWFRGTHEPLAIVELPCREPAAGEVLVRVLTCAVCSSDLHTLRGRRPTPTPCVLGHEAVGEVLAVGADTAPDLRGRALAPGQRVVWTVCASCGRCAICRRGWPQKCPHGSKFGHVAQTRDEPPRGGFATHTLLPRGVRLMRVPESLDLRAAALASCSVATAAAALRAAGDLTGRRVLVHGGGMLGIATAALAHDRGASAVLVCERDPRRRTALAAVSPKSLAVPPDQLAAACAAQTDGAGVDIAVECTGDPAALATQHELLAIGGTQLLVGSVSPSAPFTTQPQHLVRRLLTLHGVHNYAPEDLAAAVDWLQLTGVRLLPALGAGFALAAHADAIAEAERGDVLRSFVLPLAS